MRHEVQEDVLDRLQKELLSPSACILADASVPTAAYTSPQRAEADLSVAESIQTTLGAGMEAQFHIGGLELPIRWFHDELENAQ